MEKLGPTEESGVVNFLKPAGMTSHDCVYLLRKITGIKRIGHTGTLDPMAAGVLPLCVGKATRIMDYLDLDHKTYRCEMILGLTTDTWDIWGNVTRDKRGQFVMPDIDTVNKTINLFCGEIWQLPPAYSSIRVDGKRLYEYAREGQEIKVSKRPVIIHQIQLLSYDQDKGRIVFDLVSSKGTYVRSICHEIGEILGCGGSMSFLLRMASGEFSINNSVPAKDLDKNWREYLLPTDYPLKKLGKIMIEDHRVPWFSNGGYLRKSEGTIVTMPDIKESNNHIKVREGLGLSYRVYSKTGSFLGVAVYDQDKKIYTADKVMCK